MNSKDKINLIMNIRSRILDNTKVKDKDFAEEIARRWVE